MTSTDSPSTLAALFLEAAEKRPKPDALLTKKDGRYQPVSSAEMLEMVAALASALVKRGVLPGDRVAILSDNRLEWSISDYAVLSLGAQTVPIYPTLLETDLEYILRDSGSKGVVVSSVDQLRKVRSVHSRLSDLRFVLVMDPVDAPSDPETPVEHWWDVVGRERKPGTVEALREAIGRIRAEDVATILYTSGTTGNPKGVVLTHSNVVSNIHSATELFPNELRGTTLSFLPLAHIFERMLEFACLHCGVSIAYAESIDAMPQNMLEVRPTVLAVVPRVLEKMFERVNDAIRQAPPVRQKLFGWAQRVGGEAAEYRMQGRALPAGLALRFKLADKLVFSKVKARLGGRVGAIVSGSAPLSPEVARFFWSVGLAVYEGYGLTETSPVIAVNTPGKTRLGTVGPVIPGVEVKLGEDYSNDEDKVGREILVRGPNVSPGYYRLDEENRQSFVDGWFCTGDLGALDPDGYLRITGRKKCLFKTSGGKYVPPEKLENLFQGHPCVSQVLVIGDRRKFVSALIVPNFARIEAYAKEHGIAFANHEELVKHHEIQAFLERQVEGLMAPLPPHERVRQITLLAREFTVAAGELSATQKIRRKIVEERYADAIEEMYRRRDMHAAHVA